MTGKPFGTGYSAEPRESTPSFDDMLYSDDGFRWRARAWYASCELRPGAWDINGTPGDAP